MIPFWNILILEATDQFLDRNIIYIILLATCFISLIYFAPTQIGKKWAHLRKFPGPRALPIIGNGLQMLIKPTEFFNWSSALCKRWGDPVKMWYFNKTFIFVSTYDTAIQLLSKPNFNAKAEGFDMLWRAPGGNGLAACPAHIHTSRRKLLQPGFSRKVAENSVHIFVEESKNLVTQLKTFAETGKVFEVLELLMPCSFRFICRATFGDSLVEERTSAEALEQMKAVHLVTGNVVKRSMTPFLWHKNDFIYYNFTKDGRDTFYHGNIVNSFAANCINKRRQQRCAEVGSKNVNTNTPCFLDMLLVDLCDGGVLTDNDVVGELNDYIIAGYDTTALTIAWTLFALSSWGLADQAKIVEELDEIFDPKCPTQDLVITAVDTKKMKYLDMVVKEGLRMFPTVPIVPKAAVDDMKLNDGKVIPAGTDVIMMLNMILRDPKYFQDPNKFLPERHLKPNPAWIPFSSGVRACIGQMFAMHSVKVELALLLREYVWETVDKLETLPCMYQGFLVPEKGIRFRIKKR